MIWNGNHTLSNANSRYYFNPYSLRLEPVSTDQEAFTLISSQNLAEMKSRMQVFSEINHLYSALVRSPLFHQRFKINLDAVLAKLATTDIAYRKLCRLFPLDCPVVDFKILAKNVEKVKKWGLASMPLPEKATVKAANNTKKQQQPVRSGKPKIVADLVYPRHIHAELLTFGTLRVFNPLPESVRISKVKASCVDQTVCKPIVLQGAEGIIKAGQGLKPNMKEFSLAIDDIGKRHFLEITTTVRGKEKIKKIQLTLSAQPYNPLTSTHIFKKPDFMLIKGNIATIAPGIWQIDQPLILPSGMTLKIAAGAVLEFAPKSYLIVRGALIANGSKDKPIRLKPSIDDWKGIYVLEASTKSHLDHVWIENTKSLTSGILQLSGGVTFYRSDVALSNVMFKGSSAEDALNIVHSDFTLENCTFAKTFSDAFDSDFSNGSLVNVHFEQIGGDGLDTSGSIVKARNLSFNRVFDKAVSAGEQSQVSIFSLSAKNVGTAIVSKDNSTTTVDHLNVENYRLFAGMAYEKKNFYGPASLVISQTKLPASAFRCQSGSQMSVNGQKIDGRDFDIKALYKLGPMRKKP
ncbi:MAG: hypothetical protein L3J67_05560 [Hyphomicrobiaceae bacterium]|nr:hypothetical protein [Hyphomicrobiaceae bacterium]